MEDHIEDEIAIPDEAGFEREEVNLEGEIQEPFDPTLIRIETKPSTINLLTSRILNEEINLSTGFQRRAGIWRDDAQSRLIESMLIKIPIPAFYVDASDDDRWLVVDGLQRLTAIRRFIVSKELRLTGLEFLKDLKDKTYDELPRNFQRRINETEVTVFSIEKQTPPEVKFNIFKRINTGGLPLSSQEIRHALNQGAITELLEELADSNEFRVATGYGVSDERMGARECIIRFLAFLKFPYKPSPEKDLDGYLNEAMRQFNALPPTDISLLREDFKHTMILANDIFGLKAFRKQHTGVNRRSPINKALFEAWSVNLSRLSPSQQKICKERKQAINSEFLMLMQNRQFEDSISQATGNPTKIAYRFSAISQLIEKVIND